MSKLRAACSTKAPLGDEHRSWRKAQIHFFYQPQLSQPEDIRPLTDKGQYDAVIAAATFLPKESVFPCGGVRIGAGTGNMGSASWGGGNGEGGTAPLMNTPSFNSRATAQMAFKALLKVMPDLAVGELHTRTAAGQFDTGRDLKDFPDRKARRQAAGDHRLRQHRPRNGETGPGLRHGRGHPCAAAPPGVDRVRRLHLRAHSRRRSARRRRHFSAHRAWGR